MISVLNKFQDWLDITRKIDFLGPLALRLYLAPVFIVAGYKKWQGIENVIGWFGVGGLDLPFPEFMAYAATLSELVGGILLLAGFAVRWVCIPLMITMIVAAVTVHWDNGWLAISDKIQFFSTERTELAVDNLNELKDWLQRNFPGWYESVHEHGKLVSANEGIEFSVTYFTMLLALFFTGAGKYFSVDYWIHRGFRKTS